MTPAGDALLAVRDYVNVAVLKSLVMEQSTVANIHMSYHKILFSICIPLDMYWNSQLHYLIGSCLTYHAPPLWNMHDLAFLVERLYFAFSYTSVLGNVWLKLHIYLS